MFLINRLPTPVLSGRSPYEALFGTRPDYSFLQTFGCSCYPFLGDYGQDKLTPKTRRCVFIGYSTIHKGYCCLDSSSGRIFISRHVVFNETEFPYGLTSATPTVFSSYITPTRLPLAVAFKPALLSHSSSTLTHPDASTTASRVELPSPTTQSSSPAAILPSTTSNICAPLTQSTTPPPASPPAPIISNHHPMITCAKDGIHKPRALYTSNYPLPQRYVALLISSVHCGSSSFKAASLDSHWVSAMTDEYHALLDNQTWTLVPRTSSMNVVGYCWVYKIKERGDGPLNVTKRVLWLKASIKSMALILQTPSVQLLKPQQFVSYSQLVSLVNGVFGSLTSKMLFYMVL